MGNDSANVGAGGRQEPESTQSEQESGWNGGVTAGGHTPELEPAMWLAQSLLEQFREHQAGGESGAAVMHSPAAPAVEGPRPEPAEMQGFLARYQADQEAALRRQRKFELQTTAALESLVELSTHAFQKIQQEGAARLEGMWSGWLEGRQKKLEELEARAASLTNGQAAGTAPPQAIEKLVEVLQAGQEMHRSDLRFRKALVWLLLSAFTLGCLLVGLVVLLRF